MGSNQINSVFIDIDEAQKKLKQSLSPTTQVETVELTHLHDRILAEDCKSSIDVPLFNCSAMDGYALHFTSSKLPGKLRLIGASYAGAPFVGSVAVGECIRIMTGAVVPSDCDTVVAQENVVIHDGTIEFKSSIRKGDNVRYRGEEIKAGDSLIDAGTRLGAGAVSLLANTGHRSARVFSKIRVGIFSTGDEIVEPGEVLNPGCIYDSNRYALMSLLDKLAVEVIDLGALPDDEELIKERLIAATLKVDALITSGGVSVGDADYITKVVGESGKLNFWKISVKPGKPFAYGELEGIPFFGLPGNPVAVFVSCYQLVIPALKQMMGMTDTSTGPMFKVKTLNDLKKSPGRTEFQRGKLVSGGDGELAVETTGMQSSAALSSLVRGDCFIVLSKQCAGAVKGEYVNIQRFETLI